MPGYRVHLMGGFTAYIGLLYLLQQVRPTPLTMLEWLGFALVGSLFPDIDTKSKGQLWFYKGVALLVLLLGLTKRYALLVCTSLLCVTPLMVRHRGLFHRPWFIVLCAVGLGFCGAQCAPQYGSAFAYDALFFAVGACSHIVLDMGIVKFFK